MEVVTKKCRNAREALKKAEEEQINTCFDIAHLEFPVSCDAVAHVSSPEPLSLLDAQNQVIVAPCHAFTVERPFLALAAPGAKIVSAAASPVKALGICYAPKLRYRILSSPHTVGPLRYSFPEVCPSK